MIEIRELVIRATVEDTPQNGGPAAEQGMSENRTGKAGCCQETVDLLLQIINDKKER